MFACNCITLTSCKSGAVLHYYTCNTSAAGDFVTSAGVGNVIQITDPANFPDEYYTLTDYCTTFSCLECTDDPDRINDVNGDFLQYWNTTTYGTVCPQTQRQPAFILVNCLANVTIGRPRDIDQSPETALVTITDLSAYVGMVINIAEYPGNCYTVSGPYTQSTGCPCPQYTVTQGYADCACCLPPPPPVPCCEAPKNIQNPVHKYYLITDSDCDIRANTAFGNNYYRMFTGVRYGIKNCCGDINFDKLWIQKELADYQKLVHGTCTGAAPDLCIYVTGTTGCGSQTATYDKFVNGKWSWLFTRDNDTKGTIYWDNVNNYWVCADATTGVVAAVLLGNTQYPVGTNEQWTTLNVTPCLSVDSGLSTWTVSCEECIVPTPLACTAADTVSAQGFFD